MMKYEFMRNALLAILIITPLYAMLGTVIVNRKMAFFSDALGHSAYAGIGIGVLLGITSLKLPMVCFAIVFALVLNSIKRKKTASTDTIISVFASIGLSAGLVILARGGDFSKYSNILIGDILSVTKKEIIAFLIILLITLAFFCIFFNRLFAISINESLAKSRKIPVKFLDNLFAVLTAVIIMLSIQWVGSLIINALLIIPAAASRNISGNVREYQWFSVIISVFSGVLGLFISYSVDTATGPTIAIVLSFVFFLSLAVKPFIKKSKKQLDNHGKI